MLLVSMYDDVSERYSEPMMCATEALAIRQVKDMFLRSKSDNSPTLEHFKDYHLCKVGNFDEITGVITPLSLEYLYDCKDLFDNTSD